MNSLVSVNSFQNVLNSRIIPFQKALLSWNEHAVKVLDRCETKLDQFFPNFSFQNDYDKWLVELKAEFSKDNPFTECSEWIDNNGDDDIWYSEMAYFLAKLPFRIARNIFSLISTIVKLPINATVYTTMHPLKAPIQLAKFLVALVHELTKPEAWTLIGAGMLGTAVGTLAAIGTPLSPIVMAIGGVLTAGGFSIGLLKTAILAEKIDRLKCVGRYVLNQGLKLTESFLTGFCMSAIVGGIQKLVRSSRHNTLIYNTQKEMVEKQAADFLKEHGFPNYERIQYNKDSISLFWRVDNSPLPLAEMKNLPDAEFIIKDIHWSTQIIPAAGPNNSVVVTAFPVYKTCLGFKFALTGWEIPPIPALPGQGFSQVLPKISVATSVNRVMKTAE